MELEEYKAAVARDMKTAGLDFSVLGSPKETPLPSPFLESATSFMLTETTPDTTVEEQAVEEANEAPAAPLIRVRSRSNSTRKRTLNMYSDACPDTALISSKLPFALMAPSAFTPPFVRKFRYGQAEVENPEHCDFDLLKQTVLSTHFKVCILYSDSVKGRANVMLRLSRMPLSGSTRITGRFSCPFDKPQFSGEQIMMYFCYSIDVIVYFCRGSSSVYLIR